MKALTVTAIFDNIPTDVTVVASRGKVIYGICRTPRNDIALVELLETTMSKNLNQFGIGGVTEYVRKDVKYITFNELNRDDRERLNNIQCSVSCFVANAYLKAAFPDLAEKVCNKIQQMIKEIPNPVVYQF